ncbi:MAG: hypothetical protein MUF83_01495 [Acidimicrobiales bacterium]|jgi:hypothetical protein|nr:hypothetical protein [Acidimicrobiales bacterium]
MDTTRGSLGTDPAWAAAEALAAAVASGQHLPSLDSPVLLDSGEVLHASVTASGWRFHGVDIAFEDRRVLALGSPISFGFGLLASAIGNRRSRSEAERLAAPQWRPLGPMHVLATGRRLLALHEGAWASVWYPAIRQLIPDLPSRRLEVRFDADPPYLLLGEWVPYLTVVLVATIAIERGPESTGAATR